MSAHDLYFDRQNREISAAQFEDLLKTPNYESVYVYDDGKKIRIELLWTGMVKNARNYFASDRPIFTISCQNYSSDGKLVDAPDMNGRVFSRENRAISAVQEFLLDWTDASIDENGKFCDDGNLCKPPEPPEPPKPDAPSVSSASSFASADFAAW